MSEVSSERLFVVPTELLHRLSHFQDFTSEVDRSISVLLDPAHTSYRPRSEGMVRELAEEVAIETPYREQCIGLINDDETAVGRVHLGIVHIFDVERPAVVAGEAEIVDGSFRPVDEILPHPDDFEMWSQICPRALFADSDAQAGWHLVDFADRHTMIQ